MEPFYKQPLPFYLTRYMRNATVGGWNRRTQGPLGEVMTDFVVVRNGCRYGFNVTPGSATPEGEANLHLLDAMVMASGDYRIIYRIREQDLGRWMPDVLFLMSRFETGLFEPRMKLSLRICSMAETRAYRINRNAVDIRVPLPLWDAAIHLRRLTLRNRDVWQPAYDRFVKGRGRETAPAKLTV